MNWFKRLFTGTARSIEQTKEDQQAIDVLRARVAPFGVSALHLRSKPASAFSRLGGLPALPAGTSWPEWKGKPQAFLAQLDLAEVHSVMPSWLPSTGYLHFFFDQGQGVWGFDPKDLGAWRVLYSNSPFSSLQEHPAPQGLGPEYIPEPRTISFHRVVSLPDPARLPPSVNLDDDDSDTYFSMREEPYEGQPRHQIFGFPVAVQSDEMEEECQFVTNGVYLGNAEGRRDPRTAALKEGAKDWRLLLQLDTDDDAGWMWGDAGTLYFWVRESDARQGDFSKVWMILQCG